MNRRIILSAVLLLLLTGSAFAQTFNIKGLLLDTRDNQPLVGATVVLFKANDTTNKLGNVSDIDGNFQIGGVAPGTYLLRSSYVGYENASRTVTVTGADVDAGTIMMKGGSTTLQNVTVQATQDRAQQTGDTTAFSAGAFKTNPDATAEDLINKMPGITSTGSGIKVNGEDVKQVLVDGKPFFGDDPNAAIKNLPAEVIDKIQVFDKSSDQSAFTGFDDGNSQKTINIVTKRGRNNGVFGKINAGYGMDLNNQDSRYTGGGNLNFFNGDRRISIVGLANNVNQQNFSADDLLGVAGSSGSGGRGGGGRRGGGGGGFSGGAGSYGGGDGASNFLVSQQGGITQTQSGGINYSDNWGKKLKVTGSYFFNRAENTNTTELNRTYVFGNPDSAQNYHEDGTTHSINVNHRASLRMEWTIDSMNSLIINPRVSFQDNETEQNLQGINTRRNVEQSRIQNLYKANNTGYNFSNNLLFRHRFAKPGRTLSVNINTQLNDKAGDGSLYTTGDTVLDQRNSLNTDGLTLGGSINYTEPITRKSQLQLNYNPSYNHNVSDRSTYNNAGGSYTNLDTALTNRFENDYTFHRAGIGYRYNDSQFSFNATLNGQYATLTGDQTFPNTLKVDRNFTDLLPQAMFNYRFSRKENIRIFYRTNTNAPSISQLQNIVDNSNPLQLRMGNPDLRQDYTHSLSVRYGKTGGAKGNGLFIFANGSYVNNYIGNSTNIGSDGIQVSKPVNLDGSWRASSFVTYSLPVKKIKSNVNLNAGLTFNRTPAILNNLTNFANNYAFNGGLVIGSNISENIDFTLSYAGAYNIAKNTLQAQTDFNYYSQTTSLKFNWIFLKGFVFNTNMTHTLYSGLGEGYDRQFLLWNASLGYKFLKDKSLQADIYAFDILNENNSITRTITDSYIEDSRTQVLQQYLMLRLTYTLRSFKGGGSRHPDTEGMDGDRGEGRGRWRNGGGGGFPPAPGQ